MNLLYDWDRTKLVIESADSGNDIEFMIRLLDGTLADGMRQLEQSFDNNDVLTDVFVYKYHDHTYRIVVRQDFYTDFMLQLMKRRLLTRLEWKA